MGLGPLTGDGVQTAAVRALSPRAGPRATGDSQATAADTFLAVCVLAHDYVLSGAALCLPDVC